MTNTVNDQPAAVSPQLTDTLLAWQGAQSPSTRKMSLTQLGTYYLPKSGGTMTGALTVSTGPVTITTGGLVISASGFAVVGNSTINGTLSCIGQITSTSGGLRATAGDTGHNSGNVNGAHSRSSVTFATAKPSAFSNNGSSRSTAG